VVDLAAGREPAHDARRAPCAELLVVGGAAAVVGVALHFDVLDLGMLAQDRGDLAQEFVARREDPVAGRLALHLLQDDDLGLRPAYERGAAVLLRIGIGLALFVGAGVLVVADAVAVAIAGATVLLLVVAVDARHVGTRVLGVDDAVAVA